MLSATPAAFTEASTIFFSPSVMYLSQVDAPVGVLVHFVSLRNPAHEAAGGFPREMAGRLACLVLSRMEVIEVAPSVGVGDGLLQIDSSPGQHQALACVRVAEERDPPADVGIIEVNG
jgi:hypothetical protein